MRTWRFIRLKIIRRGKPILGHLMSGFMAPAFGIVLSWMAIQQAGEEVWGGFTDWRIISSLGIAVMTWGNSDWLLRVFAKSPSQIGEYFRMVLATRGILLLIALPGLLLSGLPLRISILLFCWMLAGFLVQSLQVAVIYTRRFGLAIIGELVMFLVAATGIWLRGNQLTPDDLLLYFTLGWLVKGILLIPFFRVPFFSGPFPGINFRYFSLALPFFIHQLAGLLQSRVDLYCVSWLLGDDALTGRYQVFAGLLLQLNAISGFILMPFVKNLFRMKQRQIFRFALVFLGIGVAVTGLGMPLVWLGMEYAYHVHFSMDYYVLAALMQLPLWFYGPLIYLLFKTNGQRKVVLASIGAVMVNISMNLIFIQRLELKGALLGSVVAEWFMLVMVGAYVWLQNRQPEEMNEE